MNAVQLSIQNVHGHKHSDDHQHDAIMHHQMLWHLVHQPFHFFI